MMKKNLDKALELFKKKVPCKKWAADMYACLNHNGYYVDATLVQAGSEAIAFQVMDFAMNPLYNDMTLVVPVHYAFAQNKVDKYCQLSALIARMNLQSNTNNVVLLSTRKSYKEYFSRLERNLRQ